MNSVKLYSTLSQEAVMQNLSTLSKYSNMGHELDAQIHSHRSYSSKISDLYTLKHLLSKQHLCDFLSNILLEGVHFPLETLCFQKKKHDMYEAKEYVTHKDSIKYPELFEYKLITEVKNSSIL